jgi:hypothetical protein
LQIFNKFGNLGPEKKSLMSQGNFEIKKMIFLKLELKFYFWILKKVWPYHQREIEKTILKIELKFENFDHTTRGKWEKLKYATEIWNENIWKLKKWKKIIFEIWIEIWKILVIPPEGNEKLEICHENLKWKHLKILISKIWDENF